MTRDSSTDAAPLSAPLADARDSDPESTGPDLPRALLWALTVLLPGITLIWAMSHERISKQGSHDGRFLLASAVIVLLVLTVELSRRRYGLHWPDGLFSAHRSGPRAIVARLVVGAWLSTAIWGGFNYYQYDSRVISTPGDYADATYYYLNSKYFAELGYTRLYHAMLVADQEGGKRFTKVRNYRDLVAYKGFFSRDHAMERSDEVKAFFDPGQWKAFVHDVDWITSKNPNDGWNYFFIDHGYNPPPSWTLVGGTLAKLCPVEHIKWVTMVDFFLVLLMFGAIVWAFGGPIGLISLLFFLCTFSGRWPVLGQSLLRFDWLAAVVLGVCALKKARHGLAGWGLTYATLNRVFPAVFGFPYVVWMLRDAYDRFQARKQKGDATTVKNILSPLQRRFVAGALASLMVFGGGALVVVGPDAFRTSAHNLSMHGSPESYSRHRVGLMDAMGYRGEQTRAEVRKSGGMGRKQSIIWALYPTMRVVGVLAFLLIALLIWFSPLPVWRFIWLGIYPVFIMTTPQINYFNMRLLLILLHAEQLRDRRHAGLLVYLFGIEAYVNWMQSHIDHVDRYAVTTMTSVLMCGYLAAVIALFVWDVVQRRKRAAAPDEGESA